jgi:hypothetical protein
MEALPGFNPLWIDKRMAKKKENTLEKSFPRISVGKKQ